MPLPGATRREATALGHGRRDAYTVYTRGVYYTCMVRMRTNIEIEGEHLKAVMDRYGVHTKTEAVDLALRHLAGQPMTREEALAMRGAEAIGETPEDAGAGWM